MRNPYDEYECGHFYARAMSSYGLLQAFTGIRYDAAAKTLFMKPRIKGGNKIFDFTSFITTGTGYGNVGIKDGNPFIRVVKGKIDVERIKI